MVEWCSDENFQGAHEINIGFKTTQHENENEHWLNKLAVWATKKYNDIEPGGTISHAEIMLQLKPGHWRRWSIAKKNRQRGDDGELVWKPGQVFCKPVDMMNADYVFVTIHANRAQQKNIYTFLQSQVGGGFNTLGFYTNFFNPFFVFGTRKYWNGITKRKRRYFCTELIMVALQAGQVKPFMNHVACRTSPNALYRICSKLNSAMPTTNPTRKIEIQL
jgi:hypothetical protein